MDDDFSFPEDSTEEISPAISNYDPNAYEWQKARRRADRGEHFGYVAKGFGQSGGYQLWLPSPVESESWDLSDDANPVLRKSGSCFDDPAIAALRDEAFESLVAVSGVGRAFHIGAAFVKYAATLIRLNYDVSKEDLQTLLAGNGWHQDILAHLLGGHTSVRSLANANLDQLIKRPATEPQDVATVAIEPPQSESKFRRFIRRLFGR